MGTSLLSLKFAVTAKMSKIPGTYKLVDSVNFDDFMKAIGVGMVMRGMASKAKPDIVFSINGDEYCMKTVSSIRTTELPFKLGTPLKETTLDGREAETTFTLDGDVLTQVQKCSKGPHVTYTRTFTDEGLVAVCEADGTKCTRTYKRA